MTINPIDDKIITQASRCQDRFLSKACYYKEKYIQLITIIVCSVSVGLTIILSTNKLSNEFAVLKDNVKSLKEYIGKTGTGKILYKNKDGEYFFVSTEGKKWKIDSVQGVVVRGIVLKR